MKELTMKEKVLRFVEANGTARFTDIQRFIVNNKYGEGTYDNTCPRPYDNNRNPWRGYFCGAFSETACSSGYFLKGKNHLEKGTDGKYFVIRES